MNQNNIQQQPKKVKRNRILVAIFSTGLQATNAVLEEDLLSVVTMLVTFDLKGKGLKLKQIKIAAISNQQTLEIWSKLQRFQVSTQCFSACSHCCQNPAGVKQPEEPTDPFAGVLGSSSVDLRDAAAAQASQDPEQSPTVDTVYSLVVATDCVANRAEAPRSPSVSHSEAGTGAETVYSLLQRSEAATS